MKVSPSSVDNIQRGNVAGKAWCNLCKIGEIISCPLCFNGVVPPIPWSELNK